MKRKALLALLATTFLAGSVVIALPALAVDPSATIFSPDCANPDFGYEIASGTTSKDFDFSDGDVYAGSLGDTQIHVTPGDGNLQGTWYPPNAATKIEAARPVTLEISVSGFGVLASETFDYRDCFMYLAHDDFEDPESSKTVRVGNDASATATTVTGNANRLRVSRFAVPQGMTQLTSCSAYLDRTGAGSGYAADCVVYDEDNKLPDDLIGYVQLNSNVNNAFAPTSHPDWYSASFGSPISVTGGQIIWIGTHTAKQLTHYRTDNTAQGAGGRMVSFNYGTPPADWNTGTSGDTQQNQEYVVYASGTDSTGRSITTGNGAGNRTADEGGTWAGSGRSGVRGLAWDQVDMGGLRGDLTDAEGAAMATRSHETVGFATLDAGTNDEYSVSALVEMSPTTTNAAPGVTVAFHDSVTNVFFKAEVTTSGSDPHDNGALAGGVTSDGGIHSGEDEGCLRNDIGLVEGEQYWINVSVDGDVFLGQVFENRGTYGYSSLADPLGKCKIVLSEHRLADDPHTCNASHSNPGSGSDTCKKYYLSSGAETQILAATKVGIRSKILTLGAPDNNGGPEDDGLSRWLEFYAYGTGDCV